MEWPAQQEWVRRYFVFEPATYGLEGLANLQNTMLNNGLQWVGLGCSSKHSFYGIRWSQMSGSWCRQAFDENTNKYKEL
ncbi:MAG: hypothetical protein EBQ50_01780 [Burkholderiaceae bacterium]|nr:hypothetical protein [Burkholderiaceae bacterium]